MIKALPGWISDFLESLSDITQMSVLCYFSRKVKEIHCCQCTQDSSLDHYYFGYVFIQLFTNLNQFKFAGYSSSNGLWPVYMRVHGIQMSQVKQAGFISTCVCVSWLQVCQGRTTGCKAFCCLQISTFLPADSDGEASKHGGEVLLSLDCIRASLCLFVSFSTIPWEPSVEMLVLRGSTQQCHTFVGTFGVCIVRPFYRRNEYSAAHITMHTEIKVSLPWTRENMFCVTP